MQHAACHMLAISIRQGYVKRFNDLAAFADVVVVCTRQRGQNVNCTTAVPAAWPAC
jgi:hypothetical protein